jgi:hypothetical protein
MLVIGTISAICTRVDGHDLGAVPGWQLLDTALDRPTTSGSICMERIGLILIPSTPRERLPSARTGTNSSHNASKWPIQ